MKNHEPRPHLPPQKYRVPIKDRVQHQVRQPLWPEPEQQPLEIEPPDLRQQPLLHCLLIQSLPVRRQDYAALPGAPRSDVYGDDEVGFRAVVPGGNPGVGKPVWRQELVPPDRVWGEAAADALAEEAGFVHARDAELEGRSLKEEI